MARKLSLFGVLAACMLFLASCGGGAANTPDSVAKAFLEEIADMDFSGAKKYATESSESMLDMLESTAALAPDEAKQGGGDVEIIKTEEDGDKATVYYKSDGQEDKLKVVKEDGEWKVAFSKGEMMEDEMGGLGGDSDGDSGDMDLDFGDLGDSLDAAFEELDNALEELGEEIGSDDHDHDDHEGHEH